MQYKQSFLGRPSGSCLEAVCAARWCGVSSWGVAPLVSLPQPRCVPGGCGSPSRSRARNRVCLVSRTSTPRTSTPAGVSGLPGAPGLRGAPAGPPQLTPPPRRAGTSTIQEPRPHPARRTPEPAGVPPGYPPAAGRRARARPGAPRSIPWRPGRSNTGARGPTGVPCQLSRFRCQHQAACQLVLVVERVDWCAGCPEGVRPLVSHEG